MTTRWARVARGWVIAGFSTLVAALSHALGSGHAPGWLGVVLSMAFAGIICIGLAAPEASRTRVTVSVAVSQLIFHGLFSLGTGGGGLAALPAGAHAHDTATALAVVASAPASGSPHSGWVWASHAVAAVVTIVALRRGESAIRRVADAARLVIMSLFTAVTDPPLVPVTRTVPVRAGRITRSDLVVLASSLIRRGPPRVVAPVA